MPRSRSVDNRSAVAFCQQEGCESIAIAAGNCRKHYQRLYRHGNAAHAETVATDVNPETGRFTSFTEEKALALQIDRMGVDADGQWTPTPGQLAAIPWLIEGLPYHQVATEAGCSERAVKRWMTIPQMRRHIAEQRQARVAELEPALGMLMERATLVVLDALSPEGANDERAKYRAELAARILEQSAFKLLRARLRAQAEREQPEQDRTA